MGTNYLLFVFIFFSYSIYPQNPGRTNYSSVLHENIVKSFALNSNGCKFVNNGSYLSVHNEGGAVSIKDNKDSFPISFPLSQNYPNLFSKGTYCNPSVTIDFTLSQQTRMLLKVYYKDNNYRHYDNSFCNKGYGYVLFVVQDKHGMKLWKYF